MCLLSSPLLEASRTCAMKQSQSQNLSAAKKKKTELIIREYFMVVLVTSTIEDNGFYSSQFEDWKNAMLKAIESQCLPKTDECARLPAWKAAFLVVVMNRLKSGKFKKKERKTVGPHFSVSLLKLWHWLTLGWGPGNVNVESTQRVPPQLNTGERQLRPR